MATLHVHGCIYTYIRTFLDTCTSYPRHHRGQNLHAYWAKIFPRNSTYRVSIASYERKEIAAVMHENLLDGKLGDHFEISAETHCSILASSRSRKDRQMPVTYFFIQQFSSKNIFICFFATVI